MSENEREFKCWCLFFENLSDLYAVTLKEWNDKLTYKSESLAKMMQEREDKKKTEISETKADTVSIYSAPGVYKLDPSPSSYVIAVEGKYQQFEFSVSSLKSQTLS